MKNLRKVLVFVLFALATVFAFGLNSVKAADDYTWEKVTDSLNVDDQVIIVANGYNFAMSTEQKSNNRGQTAISKNGNSIAAISGSVQVLTVKAGKTDGTYAFYTGSGYLYAASSSKNYLRTQTTLDANASFTVTFTGAGVATVKATGSNTKNWMRYNNSSSLFSCYSSGQLDIAIYRKTVAAVNPDLEKLEAPVVSVEGKVASWNAVEGATGYSVGVYTSLAAETATYLVDTKETSYDFSKFTSAGKWYVKAQALGDSENYASSDQSDNEAIIDNGTDPIVCTPTEFLTFIDPLQSSYYLLTGTLKAFYENYKEQANNNYSAQYNNTSFYLTDGNKSVIVYRISGAEGKNLQVGDTVTVKGKLQAYNSVNQIPQNGATYVEIKPLCGVGVQTAEAENGAQHIRFVAGLNVDWREVETLTFTITDANNAENTRTVNVYKVFGTLVANGEAGVVEVTAESQGFESLFAVTVTNVAAGTTLKVTATFTTASGTYTSVAKTVAVPAAE